MNPAGLTELAAKLEATWPAVSGGLVEVANGAPGPFSPQITFLAYDLRPEDLENYPTGFNVAEYPPGDPSCATLNLEDGFRSSGMTDVRRNDLDLSNGRVARISGRITGGPQDLLGETYVVRIGSQIYQPYFETLWNLGTAFQPVFDEIVASLRPTATGALPSPSSEAHGPFNEFPHDDAALEARMPQTALGRPLCTWSTRGEVAWTVLGPEGAAAQRAILKDLGLAESSFSYAVAGRANSDDPPFIVTAFQYQGAKPDALLAQFSNWRDEIRHVGAKTVFVIQGPDEPGHAEGLDYYYPVGNVLYWIKAADDRWFEDVLSQLP